MNLPYWKTPEEEEKTARKIKFAWQRRTGLKIGQTIKFESREIPETNRETKGTENHRRKKIREGKLIKFYAHVALFDFGICRRCINNQSLERMAKEGVFTIDW